jgi:hypothetical protein
MVKTEGVLGDWITAPAYGMFFKNNPGEKLMSVWTREEKCALRCYADVQAAKSKAVSKCMKKLGRKNYSTAGVCLQPPARGIAA